MPLLPWRAVFEGTFGSWEPQDAATDGSCFAAVFLCPFSEADPGKSIDPEQERPAKEIKDYCNAEEKNGTGSSGKNHLG